MNLFRKVGAEIILSTVIFPWIVWVTIGIFSSQKVEAVQEDQYQNIMQTLSEIKQDVREIKSK
jgi:hypothetical protein